MTQARKGHLATAALRHHVTGAIERGEAEAITDVEVEDAKARVKATARNLWPTTAAEALAAEHARGDHAWRAAEADAAVLAEDCAECRAENKARAEDLNALADEVQRLGNRISDIERDALDRDLVWPTTQVQRTDALAREIRAKALSLYCPHADATGLEGEDRWECDNCGAEFIGAEAWGAKAGAE